MFSNSIKSFILLNIYFLTIANVLVLASIYFIIVKDKVMDNLYEKTQKRLMPSVLKYIENGDALQELAMQLKGHFDKNVAIDIMTEYSQEHDIDMSIKFINLGLDRFIINKVEKRPKIEQLKKLTLMRVESAYDTFMRTYSSEDADISYVSFFALSMIDLPSVKKESTVKKMIESNISNNRVIELFERFNLSIGEWAGILEKEETPRGEHSRDRRSL